MAKGNVITVSSNPKGQPLEGIISGTPKPGTIMQVKAAVAPVAGRFTYEASAPGTDGKKILGAVLLEDDLQGKLITDAYVSGTRGKLYVPIPGEEMNLLLGEVAGTGNTYAIGDRLIIDAEDGILVPDSGSPQTAFAICNEVVTQQAGSRLTWCTIL